MKSHKSWKIRNILRGKLEKSWKFEIPCALQSWCGLSTWKNESFNAHETAEQQRQFIIIPNIWYLLLPTAEDTFLNYFKTPEGVRRIFSRFT